MKFGYERDNPCRGIGYAALPDNEGGEQTVATRVRQADDLLPAFRPDAVGDSGGAGHFHSPRFAGLPAVVGRRERLRHPSGVRRAAEPGRFGAGLPDWGGVHRGRQRVPCSRRQYILRQFLYEDAEGGGGNGGGAWEGHRVRLLGKRPGALRGGGGGQGLQRAGHRGEAERAEVELRRGGAVFLPEQGGGGGERSEAFRPWRVGDHEREPGVPS